MSRDEVSGPDLAGVIADANEAGLPYVVIGGFSVIFHGYVRATRDSDLLVPDGEDVDVAILRFFELTEARHLSDGKEVTIEDIANAEHLRVNSRRGIIDVIRGGSPPLDFDTVSKRAEATEWKGQAIRVAALQSLVGFKRLARRPQDRVDLEELRAIHGQLPEEPIPGLDKEPG